MNWIVEEFRQLVKKCENTLSDTRRQKSNKAYSRRHWITGVEGGPLLSSKEFTAEARNVLNHVNTLSRMLSSLRRPYLNLDSGTSAYFRQPARNLDLGAGEGQWSLIRHLTNDERDQLDLQARIVLSGCANRVKEMESLEKRRVELVAKQVNPVLRFLPSRLTRDAKPDSSEFVAAHHAGVAWFLNKRLAEVSQVQKEMQEERIKRQMERAKTLGSGAAREADDLRNYHPFPVGVGSQSKQVGWLDSINYPSSLASGLASTLTSFDTAAKVGTSKRPPKEVDESSDDETEKAGLTSSQILQFESENANIFRSMQDTLASVQLAESRLLDISTLQTELVAHLTRQTEIIEQLYEDAIATTSAVEKGNIQLRDATRRAKDGRMFILLFFVGASLALLFVHLY